MSKKSLGLGKGLNSLFGEDTMDKIEHEDSEKTSNTVKKVDILKVEPNKNQPRKHFDEEALAELADSIKTHGLLSPIVVRRNGDSFQIIAGERRWRASKKAGLTEVDIIEIEADDKSVMELALIENLQREDLNPIEEAAGYKNLMENFSLSQEEVAKRVGKSRSNIANTLRLLALSDEILKMISEGTVTSGHGRAILAVNDKEKHLEFAKLIAEKAVSVRQSEALAKKLNKEVKEKVKEENPIELYINEMASNLESSLGRRIKISASSNNKGTIELEYYNDDDLENLVRALNSLNI